MAIVYIGLGSNLGNTKVHLNKAIKELNAKIGKMITVSTFYQTAPWGFESENEFLNCVAKFETALHPFQLLEVTQQIEKEMGRTKKSVGGYSDRIIDIDILMYNNLVLDTPLLKIPHPLITERDFVLIPFAEIAPDVVHPLLGVTIKELL